ncbi:MAG: hypothetical protein IPK83_12005 [Planctomycetes bacterium]|nr:hypothetical protein [Planctomycetota bacterium]
MSQALQRKLVLLFLLAPLPLAARCQNPNGTESVSDSKFPASQPSAQAPDADNQTKPAVQTPAPDTSATAATLEGPAYTFKFSIPADKTLYFVVENNFTDRGGVPPLLSFTTFADDKRTLIQTRAPLGSGGTRPSQPGEVTMLWQCDRFEVRERGLKEEVKFDSLRDSYPRAERCANWVRFGSKVIFDLNMRTGDARNRRIDHNKFIGPPTRRRLSRTTMRCAVNEENLAKLMDDLGRSTSPENLCESAKRGQQREAKPSKASDKRISITHFN